MSLIKVISPKQYAALADNASTTYVIECQRVIPMKSNFTIWVEYSDNKDFINTKLLDVTNVDQKIDGEWRRVENSFTGNPGMLRFNCTIPTGDAIYSRVVFSNPDEKCYSKIVTNSRFEKLDCKLAKPIICKTGTTRVKVMMETIIEKPSGLNIQVFASNNANDGVNIVWEEITEAYKSGEYGILSNELIQNGVALNVRVVVTKTIPTASFMIKKITLVHL